jgi:hypothetical protein
MTGVPHTRRLRAQIVSREGKIASDLRAFALGEVVFSVYAADESGAQAASQSRNAWQDSVTNRTISWASVP